MFLVQSYSYSTNNIHALILRLFSNYVALLEKKYAKRFESVSFIVHYFFDLSNAYESCIDCAAR